PTLDPNAPKEQIAVGLGASPGAATGEVAFTADEAEKLAADGHDVILVRTETSPEDIHGMHAARGILTAGAGMTKIDAQKGVMTVGANAITRGDVITIDGTSGLVFKGKVAMRQPEMTGDFATLMSWADSIRTLKVRTNADTPNDAAAARKFGAEGIGLCRTEHMFFEPDRILAVRQMILADAKAERDAALAKLLPVQRSDFAQ